MYLSIVIPAYNEHDKIVRDVESATAFIQSGAFEGEVIVVDDGSTDGTGDIAEAACEGVMVEARVVRIEHAGKGAAVRAGILASRGEHVLIADSGLCIEFEEVLVGIEMIKSGLCEIAHGSRYAPDSEIVRKKGPLRRLASRLFRWLIPLLTGLRGKYTDTQCGFKVYKGDVARELYSLCTSDGYLFDLEVTLRAEQSAMKIEEFPVKWKSDPDSRLSLFKSLFSVILGVRRIRKAVRKLEKNK
jgi:glycosyltransferase involved in cell wall biosynthesis